MNPLVVAFATERYAAHAEAMRATATELGQEVELKRLPGKYTWDEAVRLKPQVILHCLYTALGRDGIFYVDADARWRRIPDWTVFKDIDIGFHKFTRSRQHPQEFLTGSMYFQRSNRMLGFLEAWITETEQVGASMTPEQDSLKRLLSYPRWRHIRVAELGPEWCWIKGDFEAIYGNRSPMIVHLQASRSMRKGS